MMLYEYMAGVAIWWTLVLLGLAVVVSVTLCAQAVLVELVIAPVVRLWERAFGDKIADKMWRRGIEVYDSMMLYDFDVLPRCKGGPTFVRPPGESDRQVFTVGSVREFKLLGFLRIRAWDSVCLHQGERHFRVRRKDYAKWL